MQKGRGGSVAAGGRRDTRETTGPVSVSGLEFLSTTLHTNRPTFLKDTSIPLDVLSTMEEFSLFQKGLTTTANII